MARQSGPPDLLRYSHLGIQFAVVVIAGIWVGSWLDRRLSTRGVLTLVGMFLGAGVGFYHLYRELYRAREGGGPAPGAPHSPDAGAPDAGPRRTRGGADRDPRGS